MARGHCQWRGPGPRRAAGGDPILHVGYLFPVKPEIIMRMNGLPNKARVADFQDSDGELLYSL